MITPQAVGKLVLLEGWKPFVLYLLATFRLSVHFCILLLKMETTAASHQSRVEVDNQNGSHFSDQELDFLVAMSGLLVNLVEKDSENRYRLAGASVLLPSVEGLGEERHSGVIPLLCTVFLSNQGAGDTTAGEGKPMSWDDDEAVLQGEKEAEKMIVEAYSALLLAFLSTESKSTRRAIAECLPHQKLSILVPLLERFVEFHLTLNRRPIQQFLK